MDNDQISASDSGIKVNTKMCKKDSKILAPMALGEKKKRYRRTANEIERHYK
jgi:hypothetical protein